MKFFATKENFENTNEEVIRLLLNEQKHEKELAELEKMKYDNSVREKFNLLFESGKFYELFEYMLELSKNISDGFNHNVYLLILFYIDKCVEEDKKENLMQKVLQLAKKEIEQNSLLLKM
jgi:hypothetical protein